MHVLGTVLGAAAVFLLVRALVGRADWRGIAPSRELASRGHGYALGMLTGTSYTEVDKVLMLQIAGAAMAGLYTAAFRVAAVLVIPVSALTTNALPRMFRAAGSPEWMRVFTAVGLAAAAYAALAMGLALAVAPWLPAVFGADYAPSSALLRILAAWVAMYAVHQVAGAGLTSIGRQGTRVAIEACGLGAIVVLNLALLPRLGATGAAWSLLAAESAIAVALGAGLVRGLSAQSRPQTR
jgi:O-antigen/teichoic acid export membrane protein